MSAVRHVFIIAVELVQNFIFPYHKTGCMPDDKNKRGPQDSSRINISERYEVEYWSQKFNTSPERLRDAVSMVGVMADNVGEYLKNHKKGNSETR